MEVEQHTGQHQDCPPCFAIKLSTIQFTSIDAGQRRFTERERTRDMESYAQLRHQGYQPKHVFGSSEIAAKASTPFELQNSVVMAPGIRKEMEARMQEASQV